MWRVCTLVTNVDGHNAQIKTVVYICQYIYIDWSSYNKQTKAVNTRPMFYVHYMCYICEMLRQRIFYIAGDYRN